MSYLGRPWVHSSVARAADCRSAGPWFKSGCALLSAGAGQPLSDQLRHRPSVPHRLTWVSNPVTRNRTRDHLIAALIYSQMLYQLSYDRLVLLRPQPMLTLTSSMHPPLHAPPDADARCAHPPDFSRPRRRVGCRDSASVQLHSLDQPLPCSLTSCRVAPRRISSTEITAPWEARTPDLEVSSLTL